MKASFTLVLVLGIIAAAKAADEAAAPATLPAGTCDPTVRAAGVYYKDQKSGVGFFGAWNCMNFYECSQGVEISHHCSYILPLKQYNPSTRTCEWFWKANCHADDPAN